jgi:hypothetical protein
MRNYWIVGAMYGGRDDQLPRFVRRGYWKLGWTEEEQPHMASLRDQIEPDDRIAVKRMMGRGSSDIRIVALGIVTEVDSEDGRVYVRWVVDNLDRVVEARGCFQSIHGPFAEDDNWTKEVFQL